LVERKRMIGTETYTMIFINVYHEENP